MAAGKADGTIVIASKIETDGFVKGTKELENACRRAAASVQNIGDKTRVSLQRSVDALAKQNEEYRKQRARVEELKSAISDMSKQQVETAAFRTISSDIDKIQKKLDAAIEKEIRFMETGGTTDSTTFTRMEYDIDMLRRQLAEANAAKEKLISSGGAYASADTSALVFQLANETARLDTFGRRLDNTYASLSVRLRELNTENEKASVSSRKAGSGLNGLGKSAKKAQSNMKKGIGTFIRYFIGVESLFRLVNKLRQAIGEGIKNLAQFDGKTNQSISGIMTSLNTLKNNIAASLAPLINVVAPIVTKLIDNINNAVTKLGMFIAYLTGQKTYTKAVTVWQDYAESLDGVSDSAKEAKKNLSGLDEIQAYDTGKSSEASASAKDMFETKELTEEIQTAFDNVTMETVGEKISEAFISGLGKISDLFTDTDWAKIGSSLGKQINGIDWGGIIYNITKTSANLIKGIGILIAEGFKEVESGNLWEGWLDNVIEPLFEVFAEDGYLYDYETEADRKKAENARENLPEVEANLYFDLFGMEGSPLLEKFKNDVQAGVDVIINGGEQISSNGSYVGKSWTEYIAEGINANTNNISQAQSDAMASGNLSGKTPGLSAGMTWDQYVANGINISQPTVTNAAQGVVNSVNNLITNKDSLKEAEKSGEKYGKTLINGVGEGFGLATKNGKLDFSSTLDSFKLAANGLVSSLQATLITPYEQIGKAFDNISDISIMGVKPFASLKKSILVPKVPKLATGAVIPPNAPFYAMLGDQKHGTNIEAPLDTIKQALIEAMAERGGAGGNTYNVTATARGRVLFDLVLSEGRSELVRTGKNPFDLVKA